VPTDACTLSRPPIAVHSHVLVVLQQPSAFVQSFCFTFRIRRPPRSTLFPTRRSSDLHLAAFPDGGGRDATSLLSRARRRAFPRQDRKSTRLNSSHVKISYAVFCLKKKKKDPSDARVILHATLRPQASDPSPHRSPRPC